MGKRRLKRQKQKNKMKSRIRNMVLAIILAIILIIVIYICYGVYKENKIRSVEEENMQIEKIVHTKSIIQKEELNIPETYLDFAVIAKLIIPKIEVETNVLQDYTIEGMEVCVSKFWGPGPNEIGNFCIAGHNYIRDNMFSHLGDLEIGDELYLLDNKNGKFTYTIYDIYKVKPENTLPLEQDTDGKRIVTLITCANYSKNRLIVQAVENE